MAQILTVIARTVEVEMWSSREIQHGLSNKHPLRFLPSEQLASIFSSLRYSEKQPHGSISLIHK